MPFQAPVSEFEFILKNIVPLAQVSSTHRYGEATPEVASAILQEAGRLCNDVMADLTRVGDVNPARLENGAVKCAPGFAQAYRQIAQGGWIGMAADPAYGGMGLPVSLSTAVNEMMAGANMALHLCPLLSIGQIEALEAHAPPWMRDLYLPKLISGEWTGTMNLSEPHAGTDVGAIKTKATRAPDGTYRITGQKIFITYGDHDFGGNVCHLVLARLPDGVAGAKGVSLFMVPKFIPHRDGSLGAANTLGVASLERKLGIHASPTCVMDYREAKAWLVGDEHDGMGCMFTMMNNARLSVGAQGIGVAEAAYQHAVNFARERTQGRAKNIPQAHGTIIDHPDVRRMLATMKADIFAARAIALACAQAGDLFRATGEHRYNSRAAILTPIAKAFGTDVGINVANEAIQVFGGMGFIEETGAAQYLRDARIGSIYEGTNGIQAMDLVARKLSDGGAAAFDMLAEVTEFASTTARGVHPDLAERVLRASETLSQTTRWLVAQGDLNERFAGSVPYLRAFARVLGGHYHLISATHANAAARETFARFYIHKMLPEHSSLCAHVECGASDVLALGADAF